MSGSNSKAKLYCNGKELVWRCAWCNPPRKEGVEYTSGICKKHLKQLRAETKKVKTLTKEGDKNYEPVLDTTTEQKTETRTQDDCACPS